MVLKDVWVHSEGEPVGRIKINGIFDFNGLYDVMHDWIIHQGYYFEETLYKHKVPSPAGAEQDVKWAGWKRVNAFYKYWILIYIKMWDMKEVEVIKDGVKKKLTKARLLVEFSGRAELDYSGRFTKTQFGTHLMDFLVKYVWQPEKEVSNHWDELYYRVYKLHNVVKEHLEMETKGNAYYDVW